MRLHYVFNLTLNKVDFYYIEYVAFLYSNNTNYALVCYENYFHFTLNIQSDLHIVTLYYIVTTFYKNSFFQPDFCYIKLPSHNHKSIIITNTSLI